MGIFSKMVDQVSKSIESDAKILLDKDIVPELPILFGDKFRISISPTNGKEFYSNLVQQIYEGRIQKINAIRSISNFLAFYLKKMTNDLQAQTIGSLISDYNGIEDDDWIVFSLNKSQVFEFLDLVKKASQGLEI